MCSGLEVQLLAESISDSFNFQEVELLRKKTEIASMQKFNFYR
jgi:hypothetical protein